VSDIDTGVVDSLKALDPDGRLEKRTSIRDLAMSQKCQKQTFYRATAPSSRHQSGLQHR
jgi:hypothetical protein